jgi:AcrR family transcriptional regulator
MSPRIDPAERRAEILEAALRCFNRTGYNNTSMDDIVRESGLSKGTLYWHFKNKQDLFFALFDKIILDILETLTVELDESLPAAEGLKHFLTASLEVTEHSLDMLQLPINFMIELWQDETFASHYKAMIAEFANKLEVFIKVGIANGEFREVDAHELAWALIAFYDGLILYHAYEMPGDIFQQIPLMADLVIAGLQKR